MQLFATQLSPQDHFYSSTIIVNQVLCSQEHSPTFRDAIRTTNFVPQSATDSRGKLLMLLPPAQDHP